MMIGLVWSDSSFSSVVTAPRATAVSRLTAGFKFADISDWPLAARTAEVPDSLRLEWQLDGHSLLGLRFCWLLVPKMAVDALGTLRKIAAPGGRDASVTAVLTAEDAGDLRA